MFRVKIYISLKEGVADPQGATIQHALDSLGYQGVEKVRVGKYLELKLNLQDGKKIGEQIEDMCKKILVNPVIEDFEYSIEEIKD